MHALLIALLLGSANDSGPRRTTGWVYAAESVSVQLANIKLRQQAEQSRDTIIVCLTGDYRADTSRATGFYHAPHNRYEDCDVGGNVLGDMMITEIYVDPVNNPDFRKIVLDGLDAEISQEKNAVVHGIIFDARQYLNMTTQEVVWLPMAIWKVWRKVPSASLKQS